MKFGFSLIELMVVVAIVGVLAGVAVPVYKAYTIKAKIAKCLLFVDSIAVDLKKNYSTTGSLPSTINVNGVTNISGTWTIINANDVYQVIYNTDQKTYFSIGARLRGLEGIPGYIDPTINPLNLSAVFYGFYDNAGVMTVICGAGNTTYPTRFIPASYLPSFCNCTKVAAGSCN